MARRVFSLTHSSIMLDKVEPWSWRRLRSWSPAAEGALLIGYPFSPLAYASRVLVSKGIPYVVDVGDPWILTAQRPQLRALGRRRARAAEIRLWSHASGAIVTTTGQRDALTARFPALPMLVRPNGLDVTGKPQERTECSPTRSAAVLRLAHFGQLTPARLSISSFLERLATAGRWERVELHQFGPDWTGELADQAAVRVIRHEPRPWPEIAAIAGRYDLALVVGNLDPAQLPSKAVAYLELPIPRLALVQESASDALADYVADKPGWLALPADATDVAARINDHVSRQWSSAELRAPESESWHRVADVVLSFLRTVLARRLADGHRLPTARSARPGAP